MAVDSTRMAKVLLISIPTFGISEEHKQAFSRVGPDAALALIDCHADIARKQYCLVLEAGDEILSEYIASRTIDEHELKFIAVSIAKSVAALHKKGIIHGSISMDSFMRQGGQWKFIDLADCGKVGERKKPSMAENRYPPEALRSVRDGGDFELRDRVDSWSFGCLMFELFAKREIITAAQLPGLLTSKDNVKLPPDVVKENAAIDLIEGLMRLRPEERLPLSLVIVLACVAMS